MTEEKEEQKQHYAIVRTKKVRDMINHLAIQTKDETILQIPEALHNGKVLPPTEAKSDHLFIQSITIDKNTQSGQWRIGSIKTNRGVFGVGIEQDERLHQEVITSFALYLKETFEEDLKEYLGVEDANK